MSDELRPEMERLRRHLAEEHGPIIGAQAAAIGAERFTRFAQGQSKVQAMTMFLVMSVSSVAALREYSDEQLEAIRQDARDVREAADQWATDCEELALMWRAQHRP